MKKMLIGATLAAAITIPGFAADVSELFAMERAFSKMSVEQGAAAAFDHYMAQDVVKLDGGAHAAIGHAAAMKGFEGLPADFRLEWWPKDGRIADSGELGYMWGTYEISFTQEGQAKHVHGKYTTVWLKRDGEWKAVLDTGNPSPGPEPTE